jgi:hypothetical protein
MRKFLKRGIIDHILFIFDSMNRSIKVWLMIISIGMGITLFAQQAKTQPEHAAQRKILKPTTYLGKSDNSRGALQKNTFINLMKQGLSSRDSSGKMYQVVSFDFTYAEMSLYEDSLANLIVVPDYSSNHCHGNSLPEGIADSFYERIKPGDTVYMDNVLVVHYKNKNRDPLPDSTAFLAKGMKFLIVK